MPKFRFQRLLIQVMELAPKAYASVGQSARLWAAAETAQSVTEAIYVAGSSSSKPSARFIRSCPRRWALRSGFTMPKGRAALLAREARHESEPVS
ncbi:hypothetical protein [Acidocella sp.]|uniref:hypothetical protein n=1 Tax=Acidocella sp. TaxID=50710 RepID=UPI00262C9324|nr:hypothetical protein [Acidocella sp.]